MTKTEVSCGWVVVDRAAVVKDMYFGPAWLSGERRCGPFGRGHHNLLVKDVVFRGEGKHALAGIVEAMAKMDDRFIRCGIRPGMRIEKFVPSEYGGPDDQEVVEATEADIVRMDYHLYVFPEEKSTYAFSSLVSKFTDLSGLAPGGAAAGLFERIASAIVGAHDRAKGSSDLERALKADKVVVLLTGEAHKSRVPISTHRHTHRVATLAGEILDAVEALALAKA